MEELNAREMTNLQSPEKVFHRKQHTELPILTKEERQKRSRFSLQDVEQELTFMSSNLICEKEVCLKVGAQVMCIANIGEVPYYSHDNIEDKGMKCSLCNGSQGVITRFHMDYGNPVVLFRGIQREVVMPYWVWQSENIPGVGISQIPLILAWAITIHKSQGATLDMAEIDVGSGIFECGQTYVALSRLRSLDGLYLTSFDVDKIRIHKKVKNYYDALGKAHSQQQIRVEPLEPLEPLERAKTINFNSLPQATAILIPPVSFSSFTYCP